MKIALAQINPIVGDVSSNLDKILHALDQVFAQKEDIDLIVFPELALTGYPPEDLLYSDALLARAADSLSMIQKRLHTAVAVIVGLPGVAGGELRNLAAFISHNDIQYVAKQKLPNYGVFDEARYFVAGEGSQCIEWKERRLGVMICEDGWSDSVAKQLKADGAEMLIQLNASPYYLHKQKDRFEVGKARVQETGLPLLTCNLVGGQDDLLFDGRSFILDSDHRLLGELPAFEESIGFFDLETRLFDAPKASHFTSDAAELYTALVMSIRDYFGKNGFKGAVVSLSGGVDSALVLALAVDALGADHVMAVTLPSRYSAEMSMIDARAECEHFGIPYQEFSIEPCFEAALNTLSPIFKDLPSDVTEENLQSRVRGLIAMACANKFNRLLLTTGNKSELAMGYCTLYGDMAGGFAPIKDLYKHQVYALARYRNTLSKAIPERVLTRAPSAELRMDQKDEDTLPKYALLDAILECLIERGMSIEAVISEGYEEALVREIASKLAKAEYKRRQAVLGPKVSRRAFGKDWRYPVTSGFRV
ncbi:MAG: NAD+ synthase [Gammaproteobacteria bacterium]|nr:NAD+ synthase [Gammaproteobacteria bacterium]